MGKALKRAEAFVDDGRWDRLLFRHSAYGPLLRVADVRELLWLARYGQMLATTLRAFRVELGDCGSMPCSCLPYVKRRLDGLPGPAPRRKRAKH